MPRMAKVKQTQYISSSCEITVDAMCFFNRIFNSGAFHDTANSRSSPVKFIYNYTIYPMTQYKDK